MPHSLSNSQHEWLPHKQVLSVDSISQPGTEHTGLQLCVLCFRLAACTEKVPLFLPTSLTSSWLWTHCAHDYCSSMEADAHGSLFPNAMSMKLAARLQKTHGKFLAFASQRLSASLDALKHVPTFGRKMVDCGLVDAMLLCRRQPELSCPMIVRDQCLEDLVPIVMGLTKALWSE